MRVQQLESNLLLVNEVQAGLLKRMEELIEKNYVLIKKMDETEVSMKKEEPIFKTLYIDKLYLEKYEQNNNFAQLGIKSLSGALNIGATYGKEAIPKEITEQVKEDMEKMKEMKAEMENSQPSTDQSDDIHHDESSSEVASNPSEENIPYTDIVIEDDDPPLERTHLMMTNRASKSPEARFWQFINILISKRICKLLVYYMKTKYSLYHFNYKDFTRLKRSFKALN